MSSSRALASIALAEDMIGGYDPNEIAKEIVERAAAGDMGLVLLVVRLSGRRHRGVRPEISFQLSSARSTTPANALSDSLRSPWARWLSNSAGLGSTFD